LSDFTISCLASYATALPEHTLLNNFILLTVFFAQIYSNTYVFLVILVVAQVRHYHIHHPLKGKLIVKIFDALRFA